jgi:hypothetical protein
MMNRPLWGFLICLLVFLPGCAVRVGSKTVARDRFDYSSALSNSWKEQILMNLVKIRYVDPPTFLEVSQVVATYTFERSGSVNLPSWSGESLGPAGGVSGRWAESPTITYNPMGGKKFSQSLLQPISPVAIFSLVQSGLPIDNVFSFGVRAINGLYATTNVELVQKQGDVDFYRLLKILRELQLTEGFALRVQKKGEEEGGLVVFRKRQLDETSEAKAKEVRNLLGLNPDTQEFNLAFGATPKDDKEIAMLTRSMLEILGEASAGVEVPAADVEEGRVTKPMAKTDLGEDARRFHIRVRSSSNKPDPREAYAVIHYREQWFWVDDRDLSSKRGMRFLMTLFNLAESGSTATPPVLTISKP